MKHTIELDDLELTALISHLEGQSEVMNESRLNSSNPHTPDREEILLNLVYTKVFTLAYEADKDHNVDYDLMQNYNRIYDYKLYPQVYGQMSPLNCPYCIELN